MIMLILNSIFPSKNSHPTATLLETLGVPACVPGTSTVRSFTSYGPMHRDRCYSMGFVDGYGVFSQSTLLHSTITVSIVCILFVSIESWLSHRRKIDTLTNDFSSIVTIPYPLYRHPAIAPSLPHTMSICKHHISRLQSVDNNL